MFLQVLELYRNNPRSGASLLEPVPVLPEHLVCDIVHRYVVVIAELIDCIVYGQCRVVAQSTAHIRPEDLFEPPGNMGCHDTLPILVQMASEKSVDFQCPHGIDIIAFGTLRVQKGYTDIIIPVCRSNRPVIRRNQVQLGLDERPQEGTPGGAQEVAAVIDGQDIFLDGPADHHINGHDFLLCLHAANVLKYQSK